GPPARVFAVAVNVTCPCALVLAEPTATNVALAPLPGPLICTAIPATPLPFVSFTVTTMGFAKACVTAALCPPPAAPPRHSCRCRRYRVRAASQGVRRGRKRHLSLRVGVGRAYHTERRARSAPRPADLYRDSRYPIAIRVFYRHHDGICEGLR